MKEIWGYPIIGISRGGPMWVVEVHEGFIANAERRVEELRRSNNPDNLTYVVGSLTRIVLIKPTSDLPESVL